MLWKQHKNKQYAAEALVNSKFIYSALLEIWFRDTADEGSGIIDVCPAEEAPADLRLKMWIAVESEEEEGAGSSATVNRSNTCETQLTEDRNSQTQLLITVEYNTDCNVIKQCDFEKN